VWCHAVSVGETIQLQPLLDDLQRRDPDVEIVISVTTATAFELAVKRFPRQRVVYCPLDFSWAVSEAMIRLKPSALVLVELELWPNLIAAAKSRGVPVLLINGRMSERSFRGYRKLKWFFGPVLRSLTRCLVQSEVYAERLAELGLPRSSIAVTGSLKFDGVKTDRRQPATEAIRSGFGVAETEIVLMAGSTQSPEERIALETYRDLLPLYPGLRLILVPRHAERFDEVARHVEADFGFPLLRRTQVQAAQIETAASQNTTVSGRPVLLLDTIGELAAAWGLADIAFVGGSLTQRGGQNMIEPAGYGAAVLFGPNTWNFRDVVDLLLQANAAIVVRDAAEFRTQVERLLHDADSRTRMGQTALQVVSNQRGAVERTASAILECIGGTDAERLESRSRSAHAA
jgi:3-deoxy-D-manno-octulosonic-acid transferase